MRVEDEGCWFRVYGLGLRVWGFGIRPLGGYLILSVSWAEEEFVYHVSDLSSFKWPTHSKSSPSSYEAHSNSYVQAGSWQDEGPLSVGFRGWVVEG